MPIARRAAAVLLAAALILTGCTGAVEVTPTGYTVDKADRTLTFFAPGGMGDALRITVRSEAANDIVVEAVIKRPRGSVPGAEISVEGSVVLDQPLQGRVVRTASGTEIPPVPE